MSGVRYGLFIRGQYRSGDDMAQRFEDVKAQVRLADRLGFDDLLTGMHYASAPFQQYQQIPLLARLMAETERMRIITGIVLLSLHKPLDMAEQLACLDVMSGGRLVFGAGLGYRDVEFKGFGTTQQERVDRLVENLNAIKRLWTEDNVSIKGSHFELVDATVSLKPLQKPMPPIWLGANADAAVRRAAALADTWFINPHQRMETIARQLSIYHQALEELDKPPPAELPLMRELFVAGSRDEAIRLARPYLEDEVQGLSPVGPGQGNAGGRRRSVPRFRRFDAGPVPVRLARGGGGPDHRLQQAARGQHHDPRCPLGWHAPCPGRGHVAHVRRRRDADGATGALVDFIH